VPRRRRDAALREEIQEALVSIAKVLERIALKLDAARTSTAATPKKATPQKAKAPKKRKLRLSPKRRAALKMHGAYIGRLRSLTLAQKKKVRALRAAKGVRPAIALAKKLGKR